MSFLEPRDAEKITHDLEVIGWEESQSLYNKEIMKEVCISIMGPQVHVLGRRVM